MDDRDFVIVTLESKAILIGTLKALIEKWTINKKRLVMKREREIKEN
jgi:hypothetical protein